MTAWKVRLVRSDDALLLAVPEAMADELGWNESREFTAVLRTDRTVHLFHSEQRNAHAMALAEDIMLEYSGALSALAKM